jgi:hypothetical protein
MGISINLYRVAKANTIADLKDLSGEIDKAQHTKVNLYKMTQDLAIVFMNTAEPFDDVDAIPYKILFGNAASVMTDSYQVGGFISNREVPLIASWIKDQAIDSFEGFSTMYDNVSDEVKQQLDDIGSPDKDELYHAYVQPLAAFYLAAMNEGNSIVITGE